MNWQPVDVSLTYRLGEIFLFSRSHQGYASKSHFTRVTPRSSIPSPESETAPASDFYFYPAYPIAFDPVPIATSGQWLIYTPYVFKNYFIDFRAVGGFDGYLKQFSSKSRSTLLRKVRKFADANGGSVTWRMYRSLDEVVEFLSLAWPLADATYQARLLGSGLPHSQDFVRRTELAASNDSVRAFLLFLGEKPVAYAYCFLDDGIVSYDYVGYDMSVNSLSPGTVLQFHVLQSLFEDPACSIFDFTEGEGAQKEFFSTGYQRCAKSYFFRRSLAESLLVRFHFYLNKFVEHVGLMLDRLGLKARIRKLVRARA